MPKIEEGNLAKCDLKPRAMSDGVSMVAYLISRPHQSSVGLAYFTVWKLFICPYYSTVDSYVSYLFRYLRSGG